MLSKRELIRDYLKILIIMFFGCIIGVLSVYMYEARLYPIVQVIELINPPQAPSNYINESQIHFFNGSFCIDMKADYYLSRYANSGSMRPTLDFLANGIEIEIKSPDDVHVGDMVSYSVGDNETIIHRIIKIENNSNETYYIFKGDANIYQDPLVNYSQLLRKTIAILYTQLPLIKGSYTINSYMRKGGGLINSPFFFFTKQLKHTFK